MSLPVDTKFRRVDPVNFHAPNLHDYNAVIFLLFSRIRKVSALLPACGFVLLRVAAMETSVSSSSIPFPGEFKSVEVEKPKTKEEMSESFAL